LKNLAREMAKVKKGVIAAAGRGTRFLPVTKAYPKELVPILEKPNIQYLVEELLAAGVDEIAIVHRHADPALKRYFTPDKELEKFLKENSKEEFLESLKRIWQKAKALRFIPQPQHLPYGNASPVLAAKNFLKNDPFVFMFGDDLLIEKKTGQYLKKLISYYEKYQPAIILGAQEVSREEISRYASIKYQDDPRYPYRASAVLEKLPAEKAPSLVAQFGRFVVSPEIFPVLAAQELSRDNELWFADAVNTLAKTKVALAVPLTDATWMTTGDPLRWLETNLVVGLSHPQIGPELKKFLRKNL